MQWGKMKRKLGGILGLYILFVTILIFFVFSGKKGQYHEEEVNQDWIRNQIIALNEIEQLTEEIKNTEEKEKQAELEKAIQLLRQECSQEWQEVVNKDWHAQKNSHIWYIYILFLLFGVMVLSYVYIKIVRPFERLENYVGEIAKGNFEVNLPYERTNYFGEFTWAFDHMRREIIKARACEKEAIDNNKTVIATLSHDIKTPIASIRAYTEGLEANLDTTPDKRRNYLNVIINKCDEVTKLTNDLFLHSLADLEKLKVTLKSVKMEEILEAIVHDLLGEENDIILEKPLPEGSVLLDSKRWEQVIENLVNNARKYAAGSKIVIGAYIVEKEYRVVVQDFGEGPCAEDIPFLFEKFYRGRNIKGKSGSGLGLYIVKYIMEQMGGEVSLKHSEEGMAVELRLNQITDKKD